MGAECFMILFWLFSEMLWTDTGQAQAGPGTSPAPVTSMCLWRKSWLVFSSCFVANDSTLFTLAKMLPGKY